MKAFVILSILFVIPSYSHAIECKILREDGVTLYGECLKVKDEAIFRSCLDYTCKVDKELTRPLDKGEKGCTSSPLNEKDFKAAIEKEHSTLDPKNIPYCLHSKKQKEP